MSAATPSQTVGPFFSHALPWPDGPYVVPAGTQGAVWLRGTVLDGYSYGYPVFPVEECIFDRSRTSHLVNLFEMNAKYASVIQLSEALDYVNKIKRMEGRKAIAS